MIRGKTSVVGRMPVLGGHDQRKHRLQLVDNQADGIAVWHRERAARQEVGLNINQDECFLKYFTAWLK